MYVFLYSPRRRLIIPIVVGLPRIPSTPRSTCHCFRSDIITHTHIFGGITLQLLLLFTRVRIQLKWKHCVATRGMNGGQR